MLYHILKDSKKCGIIPCFDFIDCTKKAEGAFLEEQQEAILSLTSGEEEWIKELLIREIEDQFCVSVAYQDGKGGTLQ